MLNPLTVLAPAAHAPAGTAASGAATGAAHSAGNAAHSDGHSQAFARLLQRATAPAHQPVIKQPVVKQPVIKQPVAAQAPKPVAAHAAAPPARAASPRNSAAANHTAHTDAAPARAASPHKSAAASHTAHTDAAGAADAADVANALIDPRKGTQRADQGPTATDLFNPQWAPHAALLPGLQSPQLPDSAGDMLAAQGRESPAALSLGAPGLAARALPMTGLLPAGGPQAVSPGALTATAAAPGVDAAAVAASQTAAGGPGAAAPDSSADTATPLASVSWPATVAPPDSADPLNASATLNASARPDAPGPPQPAANALQPVAAPDAAAHAATHAASNADPNAATHAAPSATTNVSALTVGMTASRSQPATPVPRPGALPVTRHGDAAGALTEAGHGVDAPSRPAPGRGDARSRLADFASPWGIDGSATASPSRAADTGIDAGTGAAIIVAVADASATPMPLLSGMAGSPTTSGATGLASAPAATDGGQPLHREAHIGAAVTSPEFAPALGLSISTLARDGTQQARLHLNPAELGPITVMIALDGVGARVDFQADASTTRQAIEASLPALAGALREAGLTLTGGGVFQQPQGRPSGQDAAQGRQAQGAQAGLDIGDIGGGAGGALPALHARRGLVDLVA